MRIKNKTLSPKKVLLTIFYSVAYTVGMQVFLAPANLIATGIAGISQIIVLIPAVSALGIGYGLIYFILNVPGFVLGFSKIGYRFTMYSVISVVTVTLFSIIIPVPESLFDELIMNCIFSGIVMGYGIGGLLKIGASSGGTDFFGIILYEKYGFDFTSVNLAINLLVIGGATFIFGITIGLYTLLSFYIRNLAINQIFTSNNKLTVWIVGRDLTRVSTYINQCLGHGTTKMTGEGGYTLEEKEIIMTILTQYEYSILRDNIDAICPDAFINVTETFEIGGNFKRVRKAV